MASEVKKKPCEAIAIRYVHDVRTGEFLNIGVVLMSPGHDFLGARFINSWARITATFPDAEPVHLRRVARAIEHACERWMVATRTQLAFMRVDNLDAFLRSVIGFDDASITFSTTISGITADPVVTLNELFFTFAGRHAEQEARRARDEEEVWRNFVSLLPEPNVVMHLAPKQLAVKHYSYTFEHTWVNGQVNAAQPVSFDMLDAQRIREKATQWTGRLRIVRPSDFDLRVFFIIAMPNEGASKQIRSAAFDAMAILEDNLAGEVSLYSEDREHELATKITHDIREHQKNASS